MQSVASYSNDAFFLMAYLAFRKHNDGDDIAIAANVILANGQLTVTTDVCYGEGTILAIGPSVTFTMADVKAITANAFNAWLAEFEDFLRSKEVDVLRVASELT